MSRTPGHAPARPRSAGYRSVFAVRQFRWIFLAHLFSMLGTVLGEIALSVLVFQATNSTLLTALAFALGFLPYLISGVLLAGLSDRYRARPLLITCDLVSAGLTLAMVLPGQAIALMLTLRAVKALVAPVFTGTRAASLPAILPGDAYVLGRSLLQIVAQTMATTGFALGGLLLAVLSPRTVIMVDAISFLASAAILRLGTEPGPVTPASGRSALLGHPLAGLRALLADRLVARLMVLHWLPFLFMVAPTALAVPYAAGVHAGPGQLGVLMSALPVGMTLGRLLAGAWLAPAVRSRLVAPLATVMLAPLLLYVTHPPVPPACAVLVATGLCSAFSLGLDQWFIDAVPEQLRGRAMSVVAAGLMTGQGIGMAGAGLAAELLPAHLIIALAGALGPATVLPLVLAIRRTQKGRLDP